MREKRDWDNQIVALGRANYLPPERRDAGKEVPGTKEYTKCVYYSSPPVSLFFPYGQPLREEGGRLLARRRLPK
ncbi:hypothetical protein K438DRAFT_2045852 [Mycena galopus ATCC 62051]|nr:hypothetical protein K438DRAFT_2045852 [Mycena galopus ATCC 62051]